MLELNIKCECLDEARIYLNALEYHNLISDLYQCLRSAQKHGEDSDVLKVVSKFMPDLQHAIDHNLGAY